MFLYFKFGSEENMIDLLKNGTIYCNSLSFFAREDESGRFDTDELVVRVDTKPDGKTIIYTDQGVKLKVYNTQTKYVISDPIGNLYCLYSLNIENVPINSYHSFHQNMSDFGSHVVIIKNSKEFMQRLLSKLDELGIVSNRDFIKYEAMVDFSGIKNFFTKDIRFQYQKEYRILLDTKSIDPYKFSIGNIEDIAVIEEVNNIKEISMNGDKLQLHLKSQFKI